MKIKHISFIQLVSTFFLTFPIELMSTEVMLPKVIHASVAEMPNFADLNKKGPFCDYLRDLESISGARIDFKVYPFKRSLDNVVKGRYDFHAPLIEPLNTKHLPFSFSTVTLTTVNFIIYSNKNDPLDINNLKGKILETDFSHEYLFPHKVTPSTCIICSIRKVNVGRIDGFIYSDIPVDQMIKTEKLTNIHRSLYGKFNVKFVIQKNSQGGPVDQFLTKYVTMMKETGRFEHYPTLQPRIYEDWQP